MCATLRPLRGVFRCRVQKYSGWQPLLRQPPLEKVHIPPDAYFGTPLPNLSRFPTYSDLRSRARSNSRHGPTVGYFNTSDVLIVGLRRPSGRAITHRTDK